MDESNNLESKNIMITTEYSNRTNNVKKLIQLMIKELLLNESYNYSEIYQYYVDILKMDNISTNLSTTTTETPLHCGSLDDVATIYVEYYHTYFSIIICIFGTVANVLNIIVLTRKDMACAPINRILTALAVADMLLMIEYIPYAYYYFCVVPKRMDFSYPGAVYMLFHAHFTQILHTISICLTLTLAIWRYLAIGYPEKNHILCSQGRCTLGIIISYFLPVILCLPTYVTMTIKSLNIKEDKIYTLYHVGLSDMVKNDKTLLTVNFWIYAVFIKLLPCCILTVITCWLIRTLFKAKKRKQVLRDYDSYPLTSAGAKIITTKSERRANRTTKMLITVLFLFIVTEFPQGIFAFVIGIKGKDLYLNCYQHYGEILDMLALINGAINFILYCYMNRMFRSTFGQLFKHKLLRQLASAPPSEIHTTRDSNGTNTTEL